MLKKERSPAYPSMNLEQAIALLATFHGNTKGYAVDATDEKPVAFRELGFDKPHGDAKRALAALVSYGLIENVLGENPRKVKTSDLGRKIATYPTDDPQRPQWMREAGLRPRIFQKLISRFPEGLPPSDSPVNSFLLDQGYNPAVIGSLIKDFKATSAFAKLFDVNGGTLFTGASNEVDEMEDDAEEAKRLAEKRRLEEEATQRQRNMYTPLTPTLPPGMESLPILISPGKQVILQYPVGLTKEDIEDFDEIWTIYKKRLIRQQATRTNAPDVKLGGAMWRVNDIDQPVTVIGYYGETEGRHYARVAESETGVPMDELVYNAGS